VASHYAPLTTPHRGLVRPADVHPSARRLEEPRPLRVSPRDISILKNIARFSLRALSSPLFEHGHVERPACAGRSRPPTPPLGRDRQRTESGMAICRAHTVSITEFLELEIALRARNSRHAMPAIPGNQLVSPTVEARDRKFPCLPRFVCSLRRGRC
jgi:hypothetical protein